MPRHRRYTPQQKMEAVAAAEIGGVTVAGEQTGIPKTTIQYWLDQPEFVQLRTKTREEKRDGYRVIIARAQQRLVELIPAMEPRDLTILLGVAQDKDLLLSGDATTRTEHRSLTDEYDDDEKRRLRDFIDAIPSADAGGPGDASSDPAGAGAEVR